MGRVALSRQAAEKCGEGRSMRLRAGELTIQGHSGRGQANQRQRPAA